MKHQMNKDITAVLVFGHRCKILRKCCLKHQAERKTLERARTIIRPVQVMITRLSSIVGVSGDDLKSSSTLKIAMMKRQSHFALCAIPYFEKRKNPNPVCELHLTIHPTKKGSMQSGIPEEEKIIFQLHNNIRTSTIDDELKLLDEFGAFSLDGNGNSVHPKQLFTSREVVKQIEQSENMNLNLAYIGTDTTENLRSLLRSLKENKSVAKKIDTMYLYYTEGWDDNLNDKFPGIVIDESVTSDLFNLQFIKIPEDGSITIRCKTC